MSFWNSGQRHDDSNCTSGHIRYAETLWTYHTMFQDTRKYDSIRPLRPLQKTYPLLTTKRYNLLERIYRSIQYYHLLLLARNRLAEWKGAVTEPKPDISNGQQDMYCTCWWCCIPKSNNGKLAECSQQRVYVWSYSNAVPRVSWPRRHVHQIMLEKCQVLIRINLIIF